MPFATAGAAHVLALDAGGGAALLLLAGLVQSADRHPPAARPAGRLVQASRAYFLTSDIAASSSHEARLSSRCDRSGDRSPACSATDQPFRDGRSLTRAFRYFPACSQVCVRQKHDRSSPIRADLSRSARPAPILAAAAALFSFVLTSNMIPGRLRSRHSNHTVPMPPQLRTQLDAAVLPRQRACRSGRRKYARTLREEMVARCDLFGCRLPRRQATGKSPVKEHRTAYGVSSADGALGFRCCDPRPGQWPFRAWARSCR